MEKEEERKRTVVVEEEYFYRKNTFFTVSVMVLPESEAPEVQRNGWRTSTLKALAAETDNIQTVAQQSRGRYVPSQTGEGNCLHKRGGRERIVQRSSTYTYGQTDRQTTRDNQETRGLCPCLQIINKVFDDDYIEINDAWSGVF